jgi:DUF1365 family protein
MNSCLYYGTVRHRRHTPVEHRFRYRLFWLYLDLDELPALSEQVRGLPERQFGAATLYRPDHLGPRDVSLADSVRQFALEQAGCDLGIVSIRLLTQPRSLGFYFSPLNLYYCFAEDASLVAVIAEVNNTPWNEQHCYLLWSGNEAAEGEYLHDKQMHVSPFMSMEHEYHWPISPPGQQLSVELSTVREEGAFFDAAMTLERRPLTSWSLARHLVTSPINAARVVAAIYFEALRLWSKRCPYYPHPKTTSTPRPAVRAR